MQSSLACRTCLFSSLSVVDGTRGQTNECGSGSGEVWSTGRWLWWLSGGLALIFVCWFAYSSEPSPISWALIISILFFVFCFFSVFISLFSCFLPSCGLLDYFFEIHFHLLVMFLSVNLCIASLVLALSITLYILNCQCFDVILPVWVMIEKALFPFTCLYPPPFIIQLS